MNTASCPFKFVIGEDVPPSPQSGLWAHFVSAIKRFASFSGRATRKEYWSFVLFIVIFNLIISSSLDAIQEGIIESVILEQIKAGNMEFLAAANDGNVNVFDFGFSCVLVAFLQTLIAAIVAVPTLGVLARRCHDVGQSSIAAVIVIGGTLIINATSNFGIGEVLGQVLMVLTGVASLWLLITVLFRDSQRGSNKYGPSTKYPVDGTEVVTAAK